MPFDLGRFPLRDRVCAEFYGAVTLASGHDNLPGNRHLLRPNQALRLRSLAAEIEPRGEFVQLILGVGRQFKQGSDIPPAHLCWCFIL